MNLEEILSFAFYSGTLTLAIVLLALSILIYPTLRKHTPHKRK